MAGPEGAIKSRENMESMVVPENAEVGRNCR